MYELGTSLKKYEKLCNHTDILVFPSRWLFLTSVRGTQHPCAGRTYISTCTITMPPLSHHSATCLLPLYAQIHVYLQRPSFDECPASNCTHKHNLSNPTPNLETILRPTTNGSPKYSEVPSKPATVALVDSSSNRVNDDAETR
jgi:hypothetical protein